MPNRTAAMDARVRSACYPRGTFYQLSDGHSTLHRRITKPYFRTCLRFFSRSEAHFYPYALRAIANRAECTIALLRYLFGGDRPSQTTHLTLSTTRIHGVVLETYHEESGISLMTPPGPKAWLRRLPPILRTT